MATAAKRWTVGDVRALPGDKHRHEVIDGELFVTPVPSWRHGDAILALVKRFASYLDAHPVGHLKIAPQDVVYDEHTLVEPDLFVVPLLGGRRPRTWEAAGRVLLAVEVLSASTARADRDVKRRLFQRHGVPVYWIVDVDARLVEHWRPEDDRPEIVSRKLEWRSDVRYPPLVIELPEYFAEVVVE